MTNDPINGRRFYILLHYVRLQEHSYISSFSCSHKSSKVSQLYSHNIIYTTQRQYRHCANRSRFLTLVHIYIFRYTFPNNTHITCVLYTCIQILYNIYLDSVVAVVRENRKVIFLFFFLYLFFSFFIIFRLQRKQKRRWWTSSIIHHQMPYVYIYYITWRWRRFFFKE